MQRRESNASYWSVCEKQMVGKCLLRKTLVGAGKTKVGYGQNRRFLIRHDELGFIMVVGLRSCRHYM